MLKYVTQHFLSIHNLLEHMNYFHYRILNDSSLYDQCSKVDPADVLKIVAAVGRALAVYGTLAFREMIKNCMSQDLSWKVDIYRSFCIWDKCGINMFPNSLSSYRALRRTGN